MRRRTFLATAASIASAGCLGSFSDSPSSPSTEKPRTQTSEQDAAWPSQTNATVSSPEHAAREWLGGHHDAEMGASMVTLETVTIEVLGANVAQQVGVFTGDTDRQNSETIPEEGFEWYRASRNAYIWFVYVNFIRTGGTEMEVPPANQWRAQPVLEDETAASIKPFTESFDPDPVYYRLPGTDGREYTQPAYKTRDGPNEPVTLVFEVESDNIELQYSGPPKVSWILD